MEPKAKREFTLAHVAEVVDGELTGDPTRRITGVRPITSAGPDDITFLEDPRYLPRLDSCQAGAVLLGRGVEVPGGLATIQVDQPAVAFAEVLQLFYPPERPEPGVSPGATIAPDASIGEDCQIYPGVFVDSRATVGKRCILYPGVFVGEGVSVGDDCVLYPNVCVYRGCEIGNRVRLHAGVVIGADGFGYAQKKQGDAVEPICHRKIPQIGRVVVEDDVEIGANTTIDRAALDVTRIGRGTKIDNLVMIAHNCEVGRHSLLVAQVGVSGSTKVGSYVTIAGQAGLVGHCAIGDGATIGAQAGVTKDVAPGAVILGSPAIDASKARRAYALLEHLPDYRRRIGALERRLEALEEASSRPEEER